MTPRPVLERDVRPGSNRRWAVLDGCGYAAAIEEGQAEIEVRVVCEPISFGIEKSPAQGWKNCVGRIRHRERLRIAEGKIHGHAGVVAACDGSR